MNADNLGRESRSLRQRNCFRKLSRRGLNLVTLSSESFCERFEKRNVRRVCKIDPETHLRCHH